MVTDENSETVRDQLEQAIIALENQRAVLGDRVTDAALASMREKLFALEEAQETAQQRKLVTVLFIDIVGSSSITEDLDPEVTMAIMDTAMRRLADPVSAYGGRVTRFMGDGFLALFGAPVARENDPEMAVRAGLQILAEAHIYAQEVEEQWHVHNFSVRAGISTGPVLIGGETEAENTIMGATVNLGARLESAAKPGTLLISHDTYQLIQNVFDIEPLEPITVKGFSTPIRVYQVLRAKRQPSHFSTRSVVGIQTAMVGREADLLLLQNLFRDTTEDAEVNVVTVVGDAGMGKSRLVYEFASWIKQQPEKIRYFEGSATQESEAMPYGLIRRIFTHHFDILESDNAREVRRKFRAGMGIFLDSDQVDLVGQLLGLDFFNSPVVQARQGGESIKELAIAYLIEYLQALASVPAVISLDDIHWADDSSLDLLDYLVTMMPDTRLFVVCLARPTLYERRPSWGEGQEIHSRITLKPLSRRASRNLVAEILQITGGVPSELRDLIVERAEGNPFCIEELIKMLAEDGVIVRGEEQWRVEPNRLAEVRVPPTLTGILQARLDSLTQGEKTVLQRASVVGRLFWAAAVAELASDKDEAAQVDALLDEVRNRELIFRHEYSVFETTHEYIFNHNILRDITYETVLLKQRRVYHRQVAQWLERSAGERINEYLSLIARHYELAGEQVEAAHFLRLLGEELLWIGAFRDAVWTFERALALLPDPGHEGFEGPSPLSTADLAERAMILVNLGNSYNRVGDSLSAKDYFEEGLALARQNNDPQAEIAALIRLAQLSSEVGSFDTAKQYLDEVLILARAQDDQECVASALTMLGTIAWRWGDLEQAEKNSLESLVIFRHLNNRHRVSHIFNVLGILATLQNKHDQAERYYEEGLAMARELNAQQTVADILTNLGYLNHHSIANLEKAKRYYLESLQIAREINHQSGITSTLVNLGQLSTLLGEHRAAWKYLHEALVKSVVIGAVPLTLDALVGAAQEQIEDGKPVSAAEILGLVLNHPALEVDVGQVAESLLETVREIVPGEQLEAAMERGKLLELDAVVSEIETRVEELLREQVA